MLTQSTRLSDNDLIEIAKSKGQMHLGAISERTRLAAAVTDILVERGDTSVVLKLSRNQGASFSNAGFSILAKRAEGDEELAENLGGRLDVPPQVLRDLMAKATETVRERLMAGVAGTPGRIKRPSMRRRCKSRRSICATGFPPCGKNGRRHEGAGQLNEASLVSLAHAGEYEEMVVALARWAWRRRNDRTLGAEPVL